jgi:ankyrin repeat protein
MPPKRKAQVSAVELQQEHRQDEESTIKCARGAKDKEQQEQDPGLNLDCKESINLPPPPMQADDSIITQFKPVDGQWELNSNNIKRIDPQTGQTILHNYCQHINTTPLEVYRYLIETKGCDVNVQDKDKDTSLHNALRYFNPNGDITVLTYLLSQRIVNVNTKGWNGYNLLHWACININALPIEIFKLLIETLGADVNIQNDNKDIPLHDALCYFDPNDGGNTAVLPYLLSQNGIDGNTKGWNGNTLLHLACEKINYLTLDVFELLIETLGCDVNVQDNYKDTPLHKAYSQFKPSNGGDINVWAYLINQKAVNVNTKGWNGHTLLHSVCICDIPDLKDYMGSKDDFAGPGEKLDNHREAKADTFLCQIVEVIAERCIQQVLDGNNLK